MDPGTITTRLTAGFVAQANYRPGLGICMSGATTSAICGATVTAVEQRCNLSNGCSDVANVDRPGTIIIRGGDSGGFGYGRISDGPATANFRRMINAVARVDCNIPSACDAAVVLSPHIISAIYSDLSLAHLDG